jgi:SNF2 family DNA or RNA helicase
LVKPHEWTPRVVKATSTEEDLAAWYAQHYAEYETTHDSHVDGTLYGHQLQAVERFDHSNIMAILHEQGCGKSATTLEIVARKYLRGEIDSLLVIAPNGVHRQWALEQIPKWLSPSVYREVMCFGGRGGAKNFLKFMREDALQIVCVNIDTFSTPSKWKPVAEWANSRKTFIALDESTGIKNPKTRRAERILYSFNKVTRYRNKIMSSEPLSVARAILTGTPVTNGPTDLWAMYEFLQPNYFKRNWYSFRAHFCMLASAWVEDTEGNPREITIKLSEEAWHDIHDNIFDYDEANNKYSVSFDTFNCIHQQEKFEGPYKHADELKSLINPVSDFKLLVECVDMPKQNYIRKIVDMSPEQQEAYTSMEDELIAIYHDKMATAANKVTAIIRLQQISSGFLSTKATSLDEDTLDLLPNEITWFSSVPKLEALYYDIAESHKPVIILTRFTAEAARIYEDLSREYKCCLMTGWRKIGSIEEFQQGKYEVMVANTRVVSRGFNLQNSHKIHFYTNTFSLEDRLQAEGRIFRIGQKEVCTYVDYVTLDTVDMKIVAALKQKRNLLDYVRGVDVASFLTEQDEVFQLEYTNDNGEVVF